MLSPRQNSLVSTLPGGTLPNADSAHPNTACELVISPNGRFLYANTRGANTLAVYAINSATGLLTEQQRIGTYGDVTRHFTFDPTRQWLLCANRALPPSRFCRTTPPPGTCTKLSNPSP